MSVSAPDKEVLLSPEEDIPMQQLPPQPTSYTHGYQPLTTNQSSSNAATVVMVQPSAEGQSTAASESQKPSNQVVLAFVALFLCTWCWPAIVFAIVGMIYSVQVDSQWTNKDYAGAQRASLYARRWSGAAITLGGATVAILLVYVIFQILYVTTLVISS